MTNSPRTPRITARGSAARKGPDPQQDRAVRTKAQVLMAAAELFALNGYRGTSVKDVADRVGMTKGAVYFHYPTKEALAVAVVEEQYARWPAIQEQFQAAGLSPLDTAMELLNRAALAFRDDPVIQGGARLQLERGQIDAELPLPYVDWTSLLSSLMSAAIDRGQLRPGVEPEAAARALVAGFFGMQHISDQQSRRVDILDRWREVRDLMFFALRA